MNGRLGMCREGRRGLAVSGSGRGQMTSSSEYDNEPSGFIKGE
jgi:hypothetical protein